MECEMKEPAINIDLVIQRQKYFYKTFALSSKLGILLKLCSKNPPRRQYPNHFVPF